MDSFIIMFSLFPRGQNITYTRSVLKTLLSLFHVMQLGFLYLTQHILTIFKHHVNLSTSVIFISVITIDYLSIGIVYHILYTQGIGSSDFKERFPLPLGAWDGLRYFILALPELSI